MYPDQLFLSLPQVASSVASPTQTLQHPWHFSQAVPAKYPTLVLSTGPTSAPPVSRTTSWDTAPPDSGDQGYVSPLIDLYPELDSDLEALYDSPADWAPVSNNNLQDVPSDSEADPADSESLHTEDQSCRETVRAIRS